MRTDRLPGKRQIIAVVKAASVPARGLIRAVLADKESQFVIRAVTQNLDHEESRALGALGVEVVAGDVGDEASLEKAFAGAYAAFHILLSSEHPFIHTKIAEANALARAAKSAGLQHVVWATLEDPGQTLLKHDDLTPTFKDGRWVPDSDGKNETESVFAKQGVPTTFLQTSWDPAVAAGEWTEDIGKHAYGILRNRESISKTVSITAASLAAEMAKVPGRVVAPVASAKAPLAVAAPPIASVAPPRSVPAVVPVPDPPVVPVSDLPVTVPHATAPGGRGKIIAIAAVVTALAVVGLVLARSSTGRKSAATPPAVEATSPVTVTPPALIAAVPAEEREAKAEAEAQATAKTEAEAAGTVAPPSVAERSADAVNVPVVVMNPVVAENTTAQVKRAVRQLPARRKKDDTSGPGSAAPASPAVEVPAPREPVQAVEAPRKVEPIVTPPPVVAPPAPPAAPVSATPPAFVPRPAAAPRVVAPPPGFVDPKAVAAAVRTHAAEARTCFERAVMEHSDLHGRLTVNATIDPTGRVLSASAVNGIDGGARLESCLVAGFKDWKFPAPVGGVNGNITYSFVFKGTQ